MLALKNLSISVANKQVINNLSLSFETGKNYCILGKNGSGKSSLALTIMGHPAYTVSEGTISLDGVDIREMTPDERSKAGIFLAFQSIPEIKGVKLFEFLRTMYASKVSKHISFVQFKKIIEPLLEELTIDKEFLRRDVNVGFSWGERRKIEILQLRLLEPRYIFLDEVDSGLDIDAFKAVAELMRKANHGQNTFIVITHYFTILDYIPIDEVMILENGSLVKQGDSNLAELVKNNWFGNITD